MAGKNGKKALSDERKAEIRSMVVERVRAEANYSKAARLLSEEKLPRLTGEVKPWPPMAVRDLVIKDDPALAATLVRKPKAKKAKATKPAEAKPESAAATPNAVVLREGKEPAAKPRRRSSKPVPSGMPD